MEPREKKSRRKRVCPSFVFFAREGLLPVPAAEGKQKNQKGMCGGAGGWKKSKPSRGWRLVLHEGEEVV